MERHCYYQFLSIFFENDDRMLYMDLSSRVLPVCQKTSRNLKTKLKFTFLESNLCSVVIEEQELHLLQD